MTRKSIVARQKKREKIVTRYKNKRQQLKSIFQNMNNSYDERMAAYQKFQKLPRNASPSRLVRRCSITGRPHAVYRKFGLSRIKLREAAMRGEIPGLTKSSW